MLNDLQILERVYDLATKLNSIVIDILDINLSILGPISRLAIVGIKLIIKYFHNIFPKVWFSICYFVDDKLFGLGP